MDTENIFSDLTNILFAIAAIPYKFLGIYSTVRKYLRRLRHYGYQHRWLHTVCHCVSPNKLTQDCWNQNYAGSMDTDWLTRQK